MATVPTSPPWKRFCAWWNANTARRAGIWVLDRGIVSEENLAAIRKRGGQYLVGTPRSGRKEKERAIRHRFSAHMEDALQRLAKSIETGRLKDRNKMERRLGRIQASHSQVNDLYEVALQDTPTGIRLHWAMREERRIWRDLREGAYMLRTNLQAGTAEQLWSEYMQLTEAEAAFRTLKSEIHIRPLFHQLESRVKAHVLVLFWATHYGSRSSTCSNAEHWSRQHRWPMECRMCSRCQQ